MEPRRPTAAEREREQQEAAAGRRRASARIGAVGIAVLFAAGIGVVVSPGNAVSLVAVMSLGIVLLVVAFLLIRTPMTDLLRQPPNK